MKRNFPRGNVRQPGPTPFAGLFDDGFALGIRNELADPLVHLLLLTPGAIDFRLPGRAPLI